VFERVFVQPGMQSLDKAEQAQRRVVVLVMANQLTHAPGEFSMTVEMCLNFGCLRLLLEQCFFIAEMLDHELEGIGNQVNCRVGAVMSRLGWALVAFKIAGLA